MGSAQFSSTVKVSQCNLCGTSRFHRLFVANGVQLVRCAECKLVFSNPRLDETSTADVYTSKYYESAEAYARTQDDVLQDDIHMALAMHKKLRSQGIQGDLVAIDIGCGQGHRVEAYSRAGFSALGIEPSRSACEKGSTLGRKILHGFFEDLAVPRADLISAFHVLEHCADPNRFLVHCHRNLSESGILLIEVPDFSCRSSIQQGAQWPHLYPGLHHYQFDLRTLSRYLEKSGFEIIKKNRVGGRGILGSHKDTPGKFVPGNSEKVLSSKLDWREKIFSLRHLVYKVPGGRAIARKIFWEWFRQSQFIRVQARKCH